MQAHKNIGVLSMDITFVKIGTRVYEKTLNFMRKVIKISKASQKQAAPKNFHSFIEQEIRANMPSKSFEIQHSD